jgi:FtsZ-binding cell division protein ZapB
MYTATDIALVLGALVALLGAWQGLRKMGIDNRTGIVSEYQRLNDRLDTEIQELKVTIDRERQAAIQREQALQTRIEKLEADKDRLERENSWWQDRVRQLEQILRENGIPVPPVPHHTGDAHAL